MGIPVSVLLGVPCDVLLLLFGVPTVLVLHPDTVHRVWYSTLRHGTHNAVYSDTIQPNTAHRRGCGRDQETAVIG